MAFSTFDRALVITAVGTLAGTVPEVIHSHPQVDKILLALLPSKGSRSATWPFLYANTPLSTLADLSAETMPAGRVSNLESS
jgi:hypothetical protein